MKQLMISKGTSGSERTLRWKIDIDI